MTLPTLAKTWTFTTNQRSTYVSLLSVTKDILFGLKTAWKAMSGVTVKGSSVGATSSMDGVDRWTSASAIGARVATITTNACSWIVLTCANMGGIDLCLSYVGGSDESARIAYSAGGTYAVANTQHPTVSNTDEVYFYGTATTGNGLHNTLTSLDRLWSTAVATDGSALWWTIIRNSVASHMGILQLCSSSVVSPATYSPAVVGFKTTTGTNPVLADFISTATGLARANNGIGGGNAIVTAFVGAEAYAGSISAATRTTFQPELQGAEFIFYPLSVWSETGQTRGRLGLLYDFWATTTGIATGDTFPNNTSRQFVAFGNFAMPWDGSVVVLT